MNTDMGRRPVLHLSRERYPEGTAELFYQRHLREAAASCNKKVIPSLNLIVNISPELELDRPLPAPWGVRREPLYFLSQSNTQPVVWNGFVWSSYGDGARHRVQHFVEGVDIFGGRPLSIYNGVVNMHEPGGAVLVCKYQLGRCVSVTSLAPKA